MVQKKKIGNDAMEKYLAVKKAIDLWNPYGLLPDAPNDEFDCESLMVTGKIKDGDDVMTIAKIISYVFQKQFFEEDFPLNNCIDVATSIHENLLSLRTE